MVSRIDLGKKQRVTGVTYFDEEGRGQFQRAKAVTVAGYAIETPRLLLNLACPGFENGLRTQAMPSAAILWHKRTMLSPAVLRNLC